MHPSHKHTYSSSICSQTPPPGISELIRTTTDTIRLQQTPNDTNRLPQTPKKAVQGSCWHGMAFAGVCWCLMLSGEVKRVSEEFFKAYLSVVLNIIWTCVRFRCVWGCIWVLWPCMVQQMPIFENLWKAKFHAPDTFETSKYQNLPI